jgi:hypothetical protein
MNKKTYYLFKEIIPNFLLSILFILLFDVLNYDVEITKSIYVIYFAGLFTSSCQQQTQHIEFNSVLVDVDTEQKNREINTPYFDTDALCLYIPLDTTWFSKKYDYVRFNSDTYHSILTTNYVDPNSENGIGSITHNAKTSA